MDVILSAVIFAGVTLPVIDPAMEDNVYSHRLLAEPQEAELVTPTIPLLRRETPPPAEEGQAWDDRRRPARSYRDRGAGQAGLAGQAAPPQGYRRTASEQQVPLPPTALLGAGYPLPYEQVVPGEESGNGAPVSGQRPVVSPLLGGMGVSAGAPSGSGPSRGRSSYARSRGVDSRSRHSQGFATGQFVPNRGGGESPVNPYAPAEPPTKPFADFQPTPTVSPYLNLFQGPAGLARSENYTTLVRPLLQQQSRNTQFGSQLKQLQRNAARQNQVLRSTEAGGGSYYQNTQGYYPGFQR